TERRARHTDSEIHGLSGYRHSALFCDCAFRIPQFDLLFRRYPPASATVSSGGPRRNNAARAEVTGHAWSPDGSAARIARHGQGSQRRQQRTEVDRRKVRDCANSREKRDGTDCSEGLAGSSRDAGRKEVNDEGTEYNPGNDVAAGGFRWAGANDSR